MKRLGPTRRPGNGGTVELSGIFRSYAGQFATQSFFHSLFSALLAELAVKAWRIRDPVNRQRLLFLAIVLPVVSFPLYQWINPARSSALFRMGALFDSTGWLGLEPFGAVRVGTLLLLVFLLTSLTFVFQELFPVVRHGLVRKRSIPVRDAFEDPRVASLLEPLPLSDVDVHLFEEEDPLIFSSTGRNGSIYLSTGLLDALEGEQVRAAVAHEYAHVVRGRKPLIILMFLLRSVLFFNPLVLLEFRRIVQEDEKICDDVAVRLTGRSSALASVLRRMYLEGKDPGVPEGDSRGRSLEELEMYSQKLHIESRIRRLERGPPPPDEAVWLAGLAAVAAALAINYFVV